MIKTRRDFIKKAAFASVVPIILPSHLVTAKNKPSDRITVGFIGMGKKGKQHLRTFLSTQVQVVAVCDVDTTRRESALANVNKYYQQNPKKGTADCKAYNDFRELIARDDIDAVCICTPDHWHAYPAIAAIRSGKDVYCEKPLTHNVHEAITIIKEVSKHGGVFQTGSQQRSRPEFRVACELVRNGVIGKIDHIDCSFGSPAIACDLGEEAMEPGLDWDMWLGPAPMRPYNSILSPRGIHTYFPHWRLYKEFGGGMVCDWGAHHIDIAQWGLGMDDSGPVEVVPPKNPEAIQGAFLKYANGIKVNHHSVGYGVHFFGDQGEVKVNRGKFELILDGKKVAGYARGDRRASLDSQLVLAERNFLKDSM
ncbi:MAG: Gfo/Idh/MocA family oxidoreductase [Planctomycetes bacterium]|nr:Gfo/Idh/MocA family oxidoreductase [Planctomycetota bacterium]